MSNILLSFCIPTFNRPERIVNIINQIIPFQSEEIEIVIGDDNPSFEKTQEAVKKFKDQRIKYFHNNKNLGAELTAIKNIERANGEFVFILADEDDIEMETIPWILETIKENNNLTQLCGTIGNKIPGKKIIKKFENKILKRGFDSLTELLFSYTHGSGVILKKSALDLNKATKYVGRFYMLCEIIAQACVAGDTLCTSKTFAYYGKVQYESCQPLIKGRAYWHPLYRLNAMKDRIAIINDITERMKNSEHIRNLLLFKEKIRLYRFLNESLSISFKSFCEGIIISIPIIKIFKFPRFWIELLIYILYHFSYRKLKMTHYRFLKYFIFQITKFLDIVKSSFFLRY